MWRSGDSDQSYDAWIPNYLEGRTKDLDVHCKRESQGQFQDLDLENGEKGRFHHQLE